jgi:hypothetical protein
MALPALLAKADWGLGGKSTLNLQLVGSVPTAHPTVQIGSTDKSEVRRSFGLESVVCGSDPLDPTRQDPANSRHYSD